MPKKKEEKKIVSKVEDVLDPESNHTLDTTGDDTELNHPHQAIKDG